MAKLLKKKAKVYLFETAVEEANRTVDFSEASGDTQYPLGLLYLDAVLRQKNFEVLTKYYTPLKEEECLAEIKKEIERFKPDFIGITVMSMTRVSTYKTIKMIKTNYPKIKIILGGIHASLMPQQLLENFPIDAICIGDAEESFVELLNAFLNKKSIKNIKGIAYLKNNKAIINPPRKINMDLDSLPFLSYDVYMTPKIKIVKMLSSRGCPNKCSFCCMNIPNRRIWRPRSYMNVVDEIEHVYKNYPWVKTIQFYDETMILDNQRVINICKEIIKRNIHLNFECQGRIKPVSREMFEWMEKAGFTTIFFGIETGSPKLLESIHKNITREDIINTYNILKEFPKLQVEKCLMVGLPGETKETVEETIDFVKQLYKIKPFSYNFYASPLWVFPGTEVYEIAKAKGGISDDYWLTDKPVPYYTLEHSEKWLIQMSNRIVIKTMLFKGKIFFLKKLIGKVRFDPLHYLKRFLGITSNKQIAISRSM